MADRSAQPRLADILEAIDRIRTELDGVTLAAFEVDWRKRWLVERGIEIVSEPSRHLPDALKARHSDIPWAKVAAIGNVLRHQYESISASIIWALVQRELAPLEAACRAEFSDGGETI